MATQHIYDIIENADLSDDEKDTLRRLVDRGLSATEQQQLADQMREDPQLLYELNDIVKKKEQFLHDPDKFDEILEQEEKLLEKLNSQSS